MRRKKKREREWDLVVVKGCMAKRKFRGSKLNKKDWFAYKGK